MTTMKDVRNNYGHAMATISDASFDYETEKAAALLEFDDAIVAYGTIVAKKVVKQYLLKTAKEMQQAGEVEFALALLLMASGVEDA
jgi:hypothetical protein